MRKIQVITQKEIIRPNELRQCTAVVIDVFLATSTIIFLLENNYEPIYAKKDIASAKRLADQLQDEYIMLGEEKGEEVAGFIYPDPSIINHTTETTPAIIVSTNGTRAIEGAKNAKRLYISSLTNGHIVANKIHEKDDGSSIVLICSGNDDRFSLEDFVGAGQIINYLVNNGDYELSDAAKVALLTYRHSKSQRFQDLLSARTADLLREKNFPTSMNYVLQHYEALNVLPVYEKGKIIKQ